MITSKFASVAFNTLGARLCRRQHKVIRKATFKILNRVSVRNFSSCCQLGLGLTPSLSTYSDNLGWIRKSPEMFSLLVSLICRKDLKGQSRKILDLLSFLSLRFWSSGGRSSGLKSLVTLVLQTYICMP